ncbi:MAG TPA: homoaconitase [Planctomycetes bacterium]|nr:homoaconitase [Planctomycetota bacterium]
MKQNLVEKIVQEHLAEASPAQSVTSGDYVAVRPRHVMTHDNSSAVMAKFVALGAGQIHDSHQPVFTLDHNVQDLSEENQAKYASIENFAKKHNIDFHPAGRGIGHQVMVEEGYAWPGSLVVASDSHSNMYGGIGALGTPVVRTDAAALWATGETWWQIPLVTRVELSGELQSGVSGKDLIVALCGLYSDDEVLNHAVEFSGEGVASLTMEARFTIANMTTEWGALTGVFPCDSVTLNWLRGRIGKFPAFTEENIKKLEDSPPAADTDASYAQILRVNLDEVVPCVCGPDTVKTVAPVTELAEKNIKVDKAYLLSCVNARLEDLEQAAGVLRGQKVADHVDFYMAAASDEVQKAAEAQGTWGELVAAGAEVLPPGCGPCIGMGRGLLEDGEVGISATNRNFQGRMGSREASAYLASPAVVAASAVAGYITGPESLTGLGPSHHLEIPETGPLRESTVDLVNGFPSTIEGELLFCDADNLNTDGIYPGKYTYREDLTPAEMAEVAMENYDPDFQKHAQSGDLLVGGFNFGTGSSREQAATALAYRGLSLVIAGSFSATYKRNALNNGFLLVDCPALVEWLREKKFGDSAATQRIGLTATLDFAASRLEVADQVFSFAPLGPAAQDLIASGGLEAQVKARLEA